MLLAKALHKPHVQMLRALDWRVTRLTFLQNASSSHNHPSLPPSKSYLHLTLKFSTRPNLA